MGICAAQVDVEIHQAPIFFECDKFRNIQPGIGEKFRLALQVEIEKAFGGAMRRNDSVAHAGLFCGFGEFDPVLVMTNFAGRWERDRKARAATGIFCFRCEDNVGNIGRCERGKLLTAVVFESKREANAAEVDAYALRGIVAEGDANCDDAGQEWILFWESRLVLVDARKRFRSDGHTFVGIESRGAYRWR